MYFFKGFQGQITKKQASPYYIFPVVFFVCLFVDSLGWKSRKPKITRNPKKQQQQIKPQKTKIIYL